MHMKNLFEKQENSGLIALVAIGAAAAGVLAYLYLTEGGGEVRSTVKQKLKDMAKDLASGVISDKTGIGKDTVRKAADQVAD